MRALAAAVLLACSAQATLAQTPDLRHSGLPRSEAERLERLIDDPATTRFDGDTRIRQSETIDGNLYVHRGILTVAGLVRGEIIAVDGDIVLEPGAEVTGDITVVGGNVRGAEEATLAGTVTEFGEGFGLLAQARRFHDGSDDWRGDRWNSDWDRYRGEDHGWRTDFGSADLAVRVGANYNRVEGLPVQFGPDLRTGGSNPTRLEALAVWRTDIGPLTNTERMGYAARIEQFFTRDFRIGASIRSTVEPIEGWNIADLEASLSAAMLHEDQRDYFEREGWSAYMRLAPRRSPLDIVVEYRDEKHHSLAARDPWTLFNSDELWREQPLIAEGRIRTVNAMASIDTRRGGDFAWRGWYIGANVVRGIDGDFAVPAALDVDNQPVSVQTFDTDFTTGLIDIRHFEPVGWDGSLGIRAVAGGSLDDRPLAPQYQHALGGVGTLPGYALMGADCGARQVAVQSGGGVSQFFFPSYGCDRFAMFQAEYRGGMNLHFGDDHHDHDWNFDADFNWTVFFDAARGWALGNDPSRSGTGMLYDAGLGVIVGGFGLYGAAPLNGNDRGVRLFVRLGPRF
jgi:hypothetical protein